MFHKRGTDYKKVPMGRPFAIRALRSEVEYVPQFSRIGYLDRTMKALLSQTSSGPRSQESVPNCVVQEESWGEALSPSEHWAGALHLFSISLRYQLWTV